MKCKENFIENKEIFYFLCNGKQGTNLTIEKKLKQNQNKQEIFSKR
jgi:hypothetical protein